MTIVRCSTCGVASDVSLDVPSLPGLKFRYGDEFLAKCVHPQSPDPTKWNCPNLDQAIAEMERQSHQHK